jgi:hypothetical protein
MALPANTAMLSIFAKIFDSEFVQSWGPAIVAPLVEESSKGVGVIMLILLASRLVRTSTTASSSVRLWVSDSKCSKTGCMASTRPSQHSDSIRFPTL